MVQVDVFWSYGLASGLTLAAGTRLKREKSPWYNKYFVMNLLWITLFFAPSGLYLLWEFPYWETMFLARNHLSIPSWLVTIFGITNVTQGILGYYVTRHFILKDNFKAARFQTIWSHLAMLFILVFGWDGSGWKRFTYAGNGDDWFNQVPMEWTQFFSSPVFYTLLGMGVILIPTYVWVIKEFQKS